MFAARNHQGRCSARRRSWGYPNKGLLPHVTDQKVHEPGIGFLLILRLNASATSLSSPRTLRFLPLQTPAYGRILEPASAAWPERLDYTQQPFASSGNRRVTGRPPGAASASTCFPDADPTMPPRDRLLHSQARGDGPNKKQGMSAKPLDKRFAYWDCAPALLRAQERSPRSWLGSMLRCPQ